LFCAAILERSSSRWDERRSRGRPIAPQFSQVTGISIIAGGKCQTEPGWHHEWAVAAAGIAPPSPPESAAAIPNAEFVPLESRNHIILREDREWPRLIATIREFADRHR
jgi:hypothetical protein